VKLLQIGGGHGLSLAMQAEEGSLQQLFVPGEALEEVVENISVPALFAFLSACPRRAQALAKDVRVGPLLGLLLQAQVAHPLAHARRLARVRAGGDADTARRAWRASGMCATLQI
jgi:hypothetical protein